MIGGVLGQLVVALTADTKGLEAGKGAIIGLGNEVDKVSKQTVSNFNNMGRSMQYFGWYASMYLTAPITLFGNSSIQAAREFEWSMTKIIGLVGESRSQVDAWSKDILKLGQSLGSQPKKLGEAMYFITSSGFSGAKAMEILESSTKAAAAGLGDANKLADFATSAMNAYAQEGLTASRVMDILTAAVREGKLEATGFTSQIGQVIPVASSMGVQLDEVAAAMASMSLTGTNASESVVYLRGILNAILDPAAEAEKALNMMGTSGEQLRKTIQEQGLLPALKQINDLTQKYGVNLVSKVIPNVRAMTGFLSLLGQNYEHNLQIFKEVYASTGDMNKAFETASGTIELEWNKAVANSQSAMINFGMAIKDSVIPILTALSKGLVSVSEWFAGLNPILQKAIVYFGGILALLGPLSAGLGFIIRYVLPAMKAGLVGIIGALSNPVFLAIAGVIAAGTIAYTIYKNKVNDATDAQNLFNDVLGETQSIIDQERSIDDLMKNVESMNKRQLIAVKERLEQTKMLEEEAANKVVEINKKKEKDIEAIQKLQKQAADASRGIAPLPSQTGNKGYGGASGDVFMPGKAINKLQGQLNKVNELISKMKDTEDETFGNEKVSEKIKKITDNMLAEERGINTLAEVMNGLGREYDKNGKLTSLYENTIYRLAEYMPQAANEIEKLKQKLSTTGESTKKVTKVMDDLNSELAYIGAMRVLGWTPEKADEEALSAYTQALEKMGKENITVGEDVNMITAGIQKYNERVNGSAAIMQNLRKELKSIGFESQIMGSTFNEASAQVSALQNAMMKLYEAKENGNITVMEFSSAYSNLNMQLQNAIVKQQEYQNQLMISQTLASGMVDIMGSLGKMIVGTDNAWMSLAQTILKTTQQIVVALLEQAMATIFLSSATLAEKEVARKGMMGLATAAIGIGILMALMEGANSNSKKAAKMKTGGIVPGGYPNDTFPALLTSGEEVIPANKRRDNSSKVLIGGEFKMKGKDLYLVVQKYEKHLQNVS